MVSFANWSIPSLLSNRNGHMWLYRSIHSGGSWYRKWEGSRHLRLQSPASMTLSQNRPMKHLRDPCAEKSPVPEWWMSPQQQRWCCYPGVFYSGGGRLSHHSGGGGWRPPPQPPSRVCLSCIGRCRLRRVILEYQGTSWMRPGLLVWSS